MGMETILLVAVGAWMVVVFLAVSLCRAAKRSGEAMDAALARTITDSPLTDHSLRTLDLSHAAALLGVSRETLLVWEERYGFPTSSTLDGRYSQSEVLALRDSISDGVSITAAIAHARRRSRRRSRATRAWAGDHRDGGVAS